MKIFEIVASVANESHGPSYSVPRLAEALAVAGADVELQTVGRPADGVVDGVRRRVFRHDLAGVPAVSHLRLSSALRRGLSAESAAGDVLHTHGLWLAPNVYPAAAARARGAALVVSPRGMLGDAALRFSRVRKQLFWALFQRSALASAIVVHATSMQEMEEVRRVGLANPVAVIPNGVDVPPLVQGPGSGARVVLSLGRVHPKKGLDRLIRAWSLLGPAAAAWRLRIVGPDEGGHADELRALARGLDLANVAVEPPLFGDQKLAAYREASLFVLPTLNDNFAMTVAEALAAGTPVIATQGSPWSGLDARRCGWWVEHGEGPMAGALASALALPPAALDAMGARGREWMESEFSWTRVAADMLDVYRWATQGGAPPPSVHR